MELRGPGERRRRGGAEADPAQVGGEGIFREGLHGITLPGYVSVTPGS